MTAPNLENPTMSHSIFIFISLWIGLLHSST